MNRKSFQIRLKSKKRKIIINILHEFFKEILNLSFNAFLLIQEEFSQLFLKSLYSFFVKFICILSFQLQLLFHLINLLFEPLTTIYFSYCLERYGVMVEMLVMETFLATRSMAIQTKIIRRDFRMLFALFPNDFHVFNN